MICPFPFLTSPLLTLLCVQPKSNHSALPQGTKSTKAPMPYAPHPPPSSCSLGVKPAAAKGQWPLGDMPMLTFYLLLIGSQTLQVRCQVVGNGQVANYFCSIEKFVLY